MLVIYIFTGLALALFLTYLIKTEIGFSWMQSIVAFFVLMMGVAGLAAMFQYAITPLGKWIWTNILTYDVHFGGS